VANHPAIAHRQASQFREQSSLDPEERIAGCRGMTAHFIPIPASPRGLLECLKRVCHADRTQVAGCAAQGMRLGLHLSHHVVTVSLPQQLIDVIQHGSRRGKKLLDEPDKGIIEIRAQLRECSLIEVRSIYSGDRPC